MNDSAKKVEKHETVKYTSKKNKQNPVSIFTQYLLGVVTFELTELTLPNFVRCNWKFLRKIGKNVDNVYLEPGGRVFSVKKIHFAGSGQKTTKSLGTYHFLIALIWVWVLGDVK